MKHLHAGPGAEADRSLSGTASRRLNPHDRMRPSILDRLTDDEPDRPARTEVRNVISHQTLRSQVLRDLQWLFNCINNTSQLDLRPYPQVRASVLNFGVEPLAGQRISEIEWETVRRQLTQAIIQFEPRIIAQDLTLRCISDPHSLTTHNVLSIEIKGNLWCVPWPLAFLFRTELDLEHSRYELKDSEGT